MAKIENLELMASGDTCRFLNIGTSQLGKLIMKYKIPHKMTSSGRIFLKGDLTAFQKSRAEKMKYRRKENNR